MVYSTLDIHFNLMSKIKYTVLLNTFFNYLLKIKQKNIYNCVNDRNVCRMQIYNKNTNLLIYNSNGWLQCVIFFPISWIKLSSTFSIKREINK